MLYRRAVAAVRCILLSLDGTSVERLNLCCTGSPASGHSPRRQADSEAAMNGPIFCSLS